MLHNLSAALLLSVLLIGPTAVLAVTTERPATGLVVHNRSIGPCAMPGSSCAGKAFDRVGVGLAN